MHQDSIQSHFRNVKRRSAIQAKEKISNGKNLLTNKTEIFPDDIQKPIKILPESLNFTNNKTITETNNEPSLKRKSNRNKKDSEIFEIPQDLKNNKKIKLENKANKKTKKEQKDQEESNEKIKTAKNVLLLNKSENNLSHLTTETKSIVEPENNNNINSQFIIPEKNKTEKKPENKNLKNKKPEIIKTNILKNGDLSEKTKSVIENILKNKNLKNSKSNKNTNILNDNMFISEDIIDQVEENLKSNKKFILENFSDNSDFNITLNNPLISNVDSYIQTTSNLTSNNNIIENSSSKNFVFTTPYKFNKINPDFSIENNKNILKTTEKENNLLLSFEANNKNNSNLHKTPPTISQNTINVINQLKEERKNKFKREETKERNRSESSFSLKFKYEELIKDERELLLPPSYKQLLLSFNELDQTLNFFKMSSKTTKIPIFEDIKSSIENTFKQ